MFEITVYYVPPFSQTTPPDASQVRQAMLHKMSGRQGTGIFTDYHRAQAYAWSSHHLNADLKVYAFTMTGSPFEPVEAAPSCST